MIDNVEDILKRMAIEWSMKGNKLARNTPIGRSFNTTKPLSLPEEIAKPVNYLTTEIKDLDLKQIDISNFRYVAVLVVARVNMNNRRSHE